LLTWLLMNPLDGLLTGPAAVFLKTGAPRLLALVVTILTSLDLFLGFKGLAAAAHRNAALSYQEVWRHCKNWRTDFPDEAQADEAAQAAKQYRDRLNSINRNSPHSAEVGLEKCRPAEGGGFGQLHYGVEKGSA